MQVSSCNIELIQSNLLCSKWKEAAVVGTSAVIPGR
jgi:hypothetical protein